MVTGIEKLCPICNSQLIFFDKTKRIVKTKGGKVCWVKINRLKCTGCGSVHRAIPNYILPYKHYEAELINGVIEGLITSDTLGYEDYPCESTMNIWRRNM